MQVLQVAITVYYEPFGSGVPLAQGLPSEMQLDYLQGRIFRQVDQLLEIFFQVVFESSNAFLNFILTYICHPLRYFVHPKPEESINMTTL